MPEFDYFLATTAKQKINERVEQTRRSRIPGQRDRKARHRWLNRSR